MNFCNQCKKSLKNEFFDIKKNGGYYTRCKTCREKHNKKNRENYKPRKCSPKKLCNNEECKNCFEKSFASCVDKIKFWNHELNGDVKPRNVFKTTSKKYYFMCTTCNQSEKYSVKTINNKKNLWCNFCKKKDDNKVNFFDRNCKLKTKVCGNESCKKCFEKSFASFHDKEKVKCFNIELNSGLKPINIFKGGRNYYWFTCNKCNHNFNSKMNNIISKNHSRWCPYCSNRKLCNDENCTFCYKKSFASFHDKKKVKCFNYKLNNKNPRFITKCSNKKYWFTCNKCSHNFLSEMCGVTRKKSRWCPYCSKPCQKLCNKKDCDFCYNNSFASFDKEKVKCFNYKLNNNKSPRNIFKCENKKYWFTCNKCKHDFESSISNITRKQKQWCPYCINKGEKKLYNFLINLYPKVKKEFRPKWCKNPETKKCLRFDFYIKKINLIIELDGPQHFKQISNWNCPIENTDRDIYKTKKANDNNISVIRLLQTDVLYDKNNWKKDLLHNIMLQELRIKTKNLKVINKFISKNNEYKNHINKI